MTHWRELKGYLRLVCYLMYELFGLLPLKPSWWIPKDGNSWSIFNMVNCVIFKEILKC